jgi:uncharacterized C2H2 Zn-finger protein
MSETKRNEWKCEACDASFYFRDDLIKHNVGAHGAALGVQLRNSKEAQKQRESG